MKRTAILSECGTFRTSLERIWGDGGRIVLWILLNPSRADAEIDDPTVNRTIGFAQRWGFDGIRIVNLVPFRATKPEDMYSWFLRQDNATLRKMRIDVAVEATRKPDVTMVVAGWGKPNKMMNDHISALRYHLRNVPLVALKLNQDGSPAHPLYQPYDAIPVLYAYNR